MAAFLFDTSAASDEPPEILKPDASCTTAGCHPTQAAFEYRHWDEIGSECTRCHQPEDGRHEFEMESSPDLCSECHEAFFDELDREPNEHDDPDCTDCHNPHGGAFPGMLPAKGRALCLQCHKKLIQKIERAPVEHSPVLNGDECLNCHSPHGSKEDHFLLEDAQTLCLGCHGEAVDTDGKELVDVAARLKENPVWHEPIRKKGCTTCHRPHGAKHPRLLVKSYPKKFYKNFDPKAYELCFECHDQTLVTEKTTRALTGFRDGDRNLHFLHVDRKKRGRSCRACHDIHASSNTLQIRETVPYGRWKMPIRFKQTPTGGSCYPGCHSTKAYDREKE